MIQNFIKELIKFRADEILLLVFLLLLAGGVYLLIEFTTTTDFVYSDLSVLFFAYLCIIFEEHKHQIILNKETNKLLVVEKALFRNTHKVKSQIALDEIEKVVVHSFEPLIAVFISKREIVCYKLQVCYKKDIPAEFMNFSTYVRKSIENIEKQINEFLSNSENDLVITHASCFMRRVGYILVGVYIFMSFLHVID